jgi:hypothetical protein
MLGISWLAENRLAFQEGLWSMKLVRNVCQSWVSSPIEGIITVPRLLYTFRNRTRFYSDELLAPHPTPKLEDHLLSAVRDCLFNIAAAILHIGGLSSIRNLRTRHAVVTGTHLSRGYLLEKYLTLRCPIPTSRWIAVQMSLRTPKFITIIHRTYRDSNRIRALFYDKMRLCTKWNIYSGVIRFIHTAVCLTTGPKPLQNELPT